MTGNTVGVLAPGTAVWCSDGRVGRLSDVVIDPASEAATDLVVEPLQRYRPKRRVPLWMVEPVDDGLRVGLDQAHYVQLQRVLDTDFVRVDTPKSLSKARWRVRFQTCLIPPYFAADADLVARVETRLPTRECAIRRGASVMGSLGNSLGVVVGFAVDGADVVALAVRTGVFGKGVDVAVPLDVIVGEPGDVVFLSISIHEFRELPITELVPRGFELRGFVHHQQDHVRRSRSAARDWIRSKLPDRLRR